MYQTINTASQFRDEFVKMGRGDQFTNEAFEALFDYLEQLEQDTGEAIELDPIAICCEWDELTFDELKCEYAHVDGMDDCEDIDDVEALLRDETDVIPVPGNPYLGTEDTLLVQTF